ncbi:MAG TPA: hypothetical protein VIL30_06090 [Ramlibacter sp.]|jgi:hypothetical protein
MEDTSIAGLPQYVTVKRVAAAKIMSIEEPPADVVCEGGSWLLHFEGNTPPVSVTHDWLVRRGAKPGGYFILYPDGYTSWSPADVFESTATAATNWGLSRTQEPKYMVTPFGRLANRLTGLPVDEPIFVLRAQDVCALPTLAAYRDLLPPEQRHSVDERLLAFSAFKDANAARMKLPDSKDPIPPVPHAINARAAWPFPSARKS